MSLTFATPPEMSASLPATSLADGLSASAMYSFSGVAGSAARNSSCGALLGYDAGPVSVRLAGAHYGDANKVGLNAVTAGAVATFGPLKLRATYSANKADKKTYAGLRTDVWSAGVTYAALPEKLDVTAAYYAAKRSQTGVADQRANKLYLVPEYNATKQLKLYGIADHESFNASGASLDTGTAIKAAAKSSLYVALGVSFTFST
jgi:predicted porin